MNVIVYAVKIPRNPRYHAPHGNVVRFITAMERDRYLKRCCEDCKPITIPVTR